MQDLRRPAEERSDMAREVMFFSNGNAAVFDSLGEQDTEVQGSWLLLFAEHLQKHNRDPLDYILRLPDNRKAVLFATPEGLNWRVYD